jgi:regulator of PEP synthase PpsR (kinase-PPPase family)
MGDDYFTRIDAVEFAVHHDDGANVHTLYEADIVLTGVSRTSKTPLSMYLAQRGYKTGNVPLVPNLQPPKELLELDKRKVFGLLIDAQSLTTIRQARLRAIRASPTTAYTAIDAVAEEIGWAKLLFRRNGWRVIDITGKAVEENASRIIEYYDIAQYNSPGNSGSGAPASAHAPAPTRTTGDAPSEDEGGGGRDTDPSG